MYRVLGAGAWHNLLLCLLAALLMALAPLLLLPFYSTGEGLSVVQVASRQSVCEKILPPLLQEMENAYFFSHLSVNRCFGCRRCGVDLEWMCCTQRSRVEDLLCINDG
jgi:hypothetical protein